MTTYDKSMDKVASRFNSDRDSRLHDNRVIEGLTKLLKDAPTSGLSGTTTLRVSVSISTPQLLEMLSR